MICGAFRRTQNKCERKKALIYRCLRHTGAMCPQCEPFAERLNFRAPADYVAFVRRLITQVGAGPMDVIYGDWLSIHENRRVIAILFSHDEVAVAVLRFRPKAAKIAMSTACDHQAWHSQHHEPLLRANHGTIVLLTPGRVTGKPESYAEGQQAGRRRSTRSFLDMIIGAM